MRIETISLKFPEATIKLIYMSIMESFNQFEDSSVLMSCLRILIPNFSLIKTFGSWIDNTELMTASLLSNQKTKYKNILKQEFKIVKKIISEF